MPNVQMPLVGLTADQKVDCAILCCDKKDYSFKNGRDPKISCTRMGTKKHSCVTHTLRGRDENGKLNKPGEGHLDDVCVPSNKGQSVSIPKGAGMVVVTIVPDTLVKRADGWHAIDAKFPCDNEKINEKLTLTKKGKTRSTPKFNFESTAESGVSRASDKEDVHYLLYEQDGEPVKSSKCRSPADAKKQQQKPESEGGGFECDCTDINKL